jgi:ABC-type multidrug transport system ATPase subunit
MLMLELQQIKWKPGGTDFRLVIPRLTIKPGITLLVGRNGAGKSSLLRLLATAAFPSDGEIRYDGLTADRELPVIRSLIGFVPTGTELYEEMTAGRLLHYLAELKGAANPAGIDRLMDEFRLTRDKDRKIKTLAHGVRQRIALAQAWIGSPAYLFLDEPLNALDSLERLRFIRFMAARSSRRVIVVSTHELNEWEAWADNVLWLDGGRLHYYGPIGQWNSGLSVSVWEGAIDIDRYARLDPASILQVRNDDRRFIVRCLAEEPPGPGFVLRQTTLEDAYFIRCRRLAPPRNTN